MAKPAKASIRPSATGLPQSRVIELIPRQPAMASARPVQTVRSGSKRSAKYVPMPTAKSTGAHGNRCPRCKLTCWSKKELIWRTLVTSGRVDYTARTYAPHGYREVNRPWTLSRVLPLRRRDTCISEVPAPRCSTGFMPVPNGGKFLLRIEDTDRARSTPEATEAIFAGMKWLGLDWDGEAVSQADGVARHAEVAREMLASGRAYKCFSTQEEIEAFREAARAEGRSTLFRSPWRDVAEGRSSGCALCDPREGPS